MYDYKKAKQYFDEGLKKYDNGDYEEAIKCFDEAIKNNPKDVIIYIQRGIAKTELELYDEAIADFDEAIKLDPKYGPAYYSRGTTKADLGLHEEAITNFDEAINLHPEFFILYSERGIAKAELKRYEEAAADFDEAIKLDPNFVWAYWLRGITKEKLQYYEEAKTDYDKVIEFNPKHTEAKDRKLFLSYLKGDLMPPYLYIPFFRKDIYLKSWAVWCVIASLIISFFYSFFFPESETILDIVPIESLFVLIGFFFIAFELEHRNNGKDGDEYKTKPTFKMLLKAFIVGVFLSAVPFIPGSFESFDIYIGTFIKNFLGLLFIILLYVLINRMRTLFLKISEQYKERIFIP